MLTRAWTHAVGGLDRKVTVTNSTDAELVAACLDGRAEAFDVIVERHQRAVYRLCYRFVHSHEDASDLAQDVFVRAYKSLRTFKGQASLSTWLYRIAVNVSLTHVNARPPAADVAAFAAERPRTHDATPADALLREERGEQVRAAIRQLPARQRATLILRIYQDLPHEEIARILGNSVGATKANLFHALRNLKKRLQER
jgi:RNA polymerase sigma-70 factor (ECF subfamily)